MVIYRCLNRYAGSFLVPICVLYLRGNLFGSFWVHVITLTAQNRSRDVTFSQLRVWLFSFLWQLKLVKTVCEESFFWQAGMGWITLFTLVVRWKGFLLAPIRTSRYHTLQSIIINKITKCVKFIEKNLAAILEVLFIDQSISIVLLRHEWQWILDW